MPTFSRNIIISIVLAVAAAAALLAYTAQVRHNANSGANAITVIVATHEVQSGTTVDDARSKGYLAYQTVRQSDLADGAVTSFAAVSSQVVTQNLYNGDQLTVNRVGAPKTQTAAYKVTGNFRAIRVPFDPNAGLLTDLNVGDHVDVMTSYRKNDKTFTYLSVPNALVLEVDPPSNDSGLGNAGSDGSVMLSVTEQQSLFIANALANSSGGQSSNNIWLAMVGASGATYEPITVPELPGKFPNHGIPAK
ncbi:MAG TPA: RcpC/CpaB family pilus assembly protein [Gaiellales bacterium]|jgi:Flp pilus assembly protein CpaB